MPYLGNLYYICIFFFFSKNTGPEPQYDKIMSGFKTFTTDKPFKLKYNNAILPELTVAYETWGELNADKSNAVIIHAGLSASSHAKSHEVYTVLFFVCIFYADFCHISMVVLLLSDFFYRFSY